jgi:hypothetical protein
VVTETEVTADHLAERYRGRDGVPLGSARYKGAPELRHYVVVKRWVVVLTMVAVLTASCGSDGPSAGGTFELPAEDAAEHPSAYIAVVVADPPGDDLAEGAGEHVVIRNNATIRTDMGGWWVDANGQRLPLGIGRQIDVGAELRLHPGPGETSDEAVFVGLDEEVLDDEGGVVVLRDALGGEVMRFRYGTAA